MTSLDLGRLRGPCLFFGGPYSNLQATRAVLDAAARHRVPADRIICTGDVVAYCADPAATVDSIRDRGIHVLMGNCEESLGTDAADCGCGFDPGSACDLLAVDWFRYAAGCLSDDAKKWMRELPRTIYLELAGKTLAVVHGAASRINRFVFPATPLAVKRKELALLGVDGIIAGHSGIPFTQVIDDRLWHNPGVVGMPANDGTPRVWYSLLTPADSAIVVEHLPLEYDHGSAARDMRRNGLAQEYAAALESGLWPVDDIMPGADRARRGKPVAAEPLLWMGHTRSVEATNYRCSGA